MIIGEAELRMRPNFGGFDAEVKAKTDAAVQKIAASPAASGAGSKFGKSFAGGFTGAFTAIAGLAVLRTAVNFLKGSVAAFGEAQQAQEGLSASFERFPKLADTNISRLNELNTRLQQNTRFDDEAAAAAEVLLARFNLTGKQIEQLLPLVADLARATGQDLPAAASVVGKALLGQTRALKPLGIELKTTGDRAKDFQAIVEALTQKVGGFAERQGKTATDRLIIMNHQFEEFKESVGRAALPLIEGLSRAGIALATSLQAIPAPVLKISGALIGLGAGVIIVSKLAKALEALSHITVVEGAISALGRLFAGAPAALGPIGIAVTAIAAGFKFSHDEIERNRIALEEWTKTGEAAKIPPEELERAIEGLSFVMHKSQDEIRAMLGANIDLDATTGAVTGAMGLFKGKTQEASQALGGYQSAQDIANGKLREARTAFDHASEAVKIFKADMDRLLGVTLGKEAALDQFRDDVERLAAAFKDEGRDISGTTQKGRDHRALLRRIIDDTTQWAEANITAGSTIGRATQGQIAQLKELQKRFPFLRAELQKYIDQIAKGLPPIHQKIIVDPPIRAFSGGAKQASQSGNPIGAGQGSIVNELGPEFFIAPTGGGILSAAQSARLVSALEALSSGGGSSVPGVNVNLHGDVYGFPDFVRVVSDAINAAILESLRT